MSEQPRGRVVHVNDNVPGAVYIGRAMLRSGLKGSPFGNPYKIGRDGSRMAVLASYDQDMHGLIEGWCIDPDHTSDEWSEMLIALRNKPLACWCRHDGEVRTEDNTCHGDVLLELLNEHTDDELREMGR